MVVTFCEHKQLSNMRRKLCELPLTLLLCLALLTGCGTNDFAQSAAPPLATQQTAQLPNNSVEVDDSQQGFFNLSQIPEYAGDAYVTINGNVPFFPMTRLPTNPLKLTVHWMSWDAAALRLSA